MAEIYPCISQPVFQARKLYHVCPIWQLNSQSQSARSFIIVTSTTPKAGSPHYCALYGA